MIAISMRSEDIVVTVDFVNCETILLILSCNDFKSR